MSIVPTAKRPQLAMTDPKVRECYELFNRLDGLEDKRKKLLPYRDSGIWEAAKKLGSVESEIASVKDLLEEIRLTALRAQGNGNGR